MAGEMQKHPIVASLICKNHPIVATLIMQKHPIVATDNTQKHIVATLQNTLYLPNTDTCMQTIMIPATD